MVFKLDVDSVDTLFNERVTMVKPEVWTHTRQKERVSKMRVIT